MNPIYWNNEVRFKNLLDLKVTFREKIYNVSREKEIIVFESTFKEGWILGSWWNVKFIARGLKDFTYTEKLGDLIANCRKFYIILKPYTFIYKYVLEDVYIISNNVNSGFEIFGKSEFEIERMKLFVYCSRIKDGFFESNWGLV